MKRARILLTCVALFALIGGALAFKALRFTANPAYYTTFSSATFGTIYETTSPFCAPSLWITPNNLNDPAKLKVNTFSTTTTSIKVITLQRVQGVETITRTVPLTCTLTNTYTTLGA